MFRTVPLSIIRSFSLYTQQWYMSYSFANSLWAVSRRNCPKHVEFYSKNKFEKLVHLVVFIIRIYYWTVYMFTERSVLKKEGDTMLLQTFCFLWTEQWNKIQALFSQQLNVNYFSYGWPTFAACSCSGGVRTCINDRTRTKACVYTCNAQRVNYRFSTYCDTFTSLSRLL